MIIAEPTILSKCPSWLAPLPLLLRITYPFPLPCFELSSPLFCPSLGSLTYICRQLCCLGIVSGSPGASVIIGGSEASPTSCFSLSSFPPPLPPPTSSMLPSSTRSCVYPGYSSRSSVLPLSLF